MDRSPYQPSRQRSAALREYPPSSLATSLECSAGWQGQRSSETRMEHSPPPRPKSRTGQPQPVLARGSAAEQARESDSLWQERIPEPPNSQQATRSPQPPARCWAISCPEDSPEPRDPHSGSSPPLRFPPLPCRKLPVHRLQSARLGEDFASLPASRRIRRPHSGLKSTEWPPPLRAVRTQDSRWLR